MRLTLAVLAAIVLAGCTDMATYPAGPSEKEVADARTYTGADATAHVLEAIRAGLADPMQLMLNAELTVGFNPGGGGPPR